MNKYFCDHCGNPIVSDSLSRRSLWKGNSQGLLISMDLCPKCTDKVEELIVEFAPTAYLGGHLIQTIKVPNGPS